jgi:hypothetical protein
MSHNITLGALDRCLSLAALGSEIGDSSLLLDERVDWVALISLANKQLVAPALWTGLDRASVLEQIPADVQSYLALLHSRNAVRNASIRAQCLEIGAILTTNGIRAVLLKGVTWLFDDGSPAAADRMMRDIDLLVESEHIQAASAALLSSGYHDTGQELSEEGHFHCPPLVPQAGEAVVEIHRDLAHRSDLLPAKEVINSASELTPGLLLPAMRHRIIHNVIHSQIENGDFWGGLINLHDDLDLARLVVRCGPDFDWESLAADARRAGFFPQLSGAMHAVRGTLKCPLPVPVQSFWGRIHATRCIHQRKWPFISKIAESLGFTARALAWDRDAYPLGLGSSRSLKAHILVNRRRIQRAMAAFAHIRSGGKLN